MDVLAKTSILFQVFHFLITVNESSDYCIKGEIYFFMFVSCKFIHSFNCLLCVKPGFLNIKSYYLQIECGGQSWLSASLLIKSVPVSVEQPLRELEGKDPSSVWAENSIEWPKKG